MDLYHYSIDRPLELADRSGLAEHLSSRRSSCSSAIAARHSDNARNHSRLQAAVSIRLHALPPARKLRHAALAGPFWPHSEILGTLVFVGNVTVHRRDQP